VQRGSDIIVECVTSLFRSSFDPTLPEMSVSSISQSNILGVDVLLMIFQHLEGEDLLNCKAVCRQWRGILLAGTPWRRLCHRQAESSPWWRKLHKKFESNQPTLRTEQYRDVCRRIIQANRNWRTGNFTKSTWPVDSTAINASHLAISDDFVAWNFCRFEKGEVRSGCAFMDTESLKITEIPLDSRTHTLNEMLVSKSFCYFGNFAVEIRDPKNNWRIDVRNEEEYGCYVCHMSSGSEFFVCYSAYTDNRRRIRIWKMGNPSTLLHDRPLSNEFCDLGIVKVDEQFIVARQCRSKGDTLYFISTETLEDLRILIARNCKYEYDRGLLFQCRVKGIVRIMDVASGTYFNDVRLPIRNEIGRSVDLMCSMVSSNSKFMVVSWKYFKDPSGTSHLSVYDLEAVKQPNSDPGRHLLYTLQFQFDIEKFVMDETRIAFTGMDGKNKRSVTVLNSVNFGFTQRDSSSLEKNAEVNEVVKMKIMFDPCVDSYPCY